MEPRPRFCAWCSKATGGTDLCDVCLTGLTKYPDQNQVIVAAYVDRGMRQIDHLLGCYARFEKWLTDHPPSTP